MVTGRMPVLRIGEWVRFDSDEHQVTSARTVRRMRVRYAEQGLWGLVDQRATKTNDIAGRADPRLVAAIRAELDAQTHASTGTRERLMRRVVAALTAEHGEGAVRSRSQRLLRASATSEHPTFHRNSPKLQNQPWPTSSDYRPMKERSSRCGRLPSKRPYWTVGERSASETGQNDGVGERRHVPSEVA